MWIRFTASLIGIALVLSHGAFARAQSFPVSERAPVPTESLFFTAGELFEILPVLDTIPLPRYSWILTHERKFLQSGQAPIFRKRLLEPGTYVLNAEIRGDSTAPAYRRAISITVNPRATLESGEEGLTVNGDAETPLMRTFPSKNRLGRVVLAPETHLVRLVPEDVDGMLFLDLQPSVDTDGDGNPSNDDDAPETFFRTDRTPIILWFASLAISQNIVAHTVQTDGTPLSQEIRVVSLETARREGLLTGEAHIKTAEQGDGTIAFSMRFEGDSVPDIPLITEWDFGDNEKSLLENPTHTYSVNGTYMVALTMRNMQTGESISTTTQSISIAGLPEVVEQTIPEPSEEHRPEPDPAERGSGSWSPFSGIIFIAVGILAALAILGGAAFLMLRRIRGKTGEEEVPEGEREKGKPPVLEIEKEEKDDIEWKEVMEEDREGEKKEEKEPGGSAPEPKAGGAGRLPEPPVAEERAPEWVQPKETPPKTKEKFKEEPVIEHEAPVPPWLKPIIDVKETKESPSPQPLMEKTPDKTQPQELTSEQREKRRLKRQRYRQNVKERQRSEQIVSPPSPPPPKEVGDAGGLTREKGSNAGPTPQWLKEESLTLSKAEPQSIQSRQESPKNDPIAYVEVESLGKGSADRAGPAGLPTEKEESGKKSVEDEEEK